MPSTGWNQGLLNIYICSLSIPQYHEKNKKCIATPFYPALPPFSTHSFFSNLRDLWTQCTVMMTHIMTKMSGLPHPISC